MRAAIARGADAAWAEISASSSTAKHLDRDNHRLDQSESPDEVVGHVAEAGIPEAERAVKAARDAFHQWSRTPFEKRCAAARARRRTSWIAGATNFRALEVFEVGKAWAEADGDIREAMDFCLFYAQQMRCVAGRG